jgi:hypothetical protein
MSLSTSTSSSSLVSGATGTVFIIFHDIL